MKDNLTERLAAHLAEGPHHLGQILITPISGGGYELRHRDESPPFSALRESTGPDAARQLALYTDTGEFRPLKSAPTLQRGWRLLLADTQELRLALDYLYPAMVGIWRSHQNGTLTAVPLDQTLARQTGMYAAAKRIQNDEARALIQRTCSSAKCLKRILWEMAPGQPVDGLPSGKMSPVLDPGTNACDEIPLLCHEACNILVAEARQVVKQREKDSPQPERQTQSTPPEP